MTRQRQQLAMLVGTLLFFSLASAASVRAAAPVSRTQPFILGADISWLPEDTAQGAVYYDHGVQKDVFTILKQYKFNYVRLRLFVDPSAPGGYAAGQKEAYCDLAHTEAMAKRAKAAGLGFLLDLHYSDTWASPGHQSKPSAWKSLNMADLTKIVREYTHGVVATFKAQGVTPGMVSVGNEITDGLLFPEGSVGNFDQFATLLKAGIAGVKDVDPKILIMLHHHLGRSNDKVRPWVDGLVQRGVPFDVIGLSCYAQAKEGDWVTNFTDLSQRYPDKFIVASEYSGQKRYLNDLIYNIPNKRGLGSFIWEPLRYREAIFDKDGRNAGGGANPPINLPAPAPVTGATTANTPPPAAPAPVRVTRGGRYDTNDFIALYPQMARDYASGMAVTPMPAVKPASATPPAPAATPALPPPALPAPAAATATPRVPVTVPAGVTLQANIPYDKYPDTVLDIMQPTATFQGKRPGVVMFHGGGWIRSTKETMMNSFCLPYLAQGYVVCNVEYRLAPVAPAPAAVNDALNAAAWFFQNADKYNVDTKRIVVTGASAGGHLALMVGMTPASAKLGPVAPVAAIIDCYGPTDVADLLTGPHHQSFATQWVPDQPGQVDLAKQLSPLTYVRKELPPTFICQGANDHTVPVDQSVRLMKALQDAGADVQMMTVPGAGHGFSADQWVGVHEQIFAFLKAHGVQP